MMPNFFRNPDGALFVYDVTKPSTMKKLKHWLLEMDKHAGRDDVVKVR